MATAADQVMQMSLVVMLQVRVIQLLLLVVMYKAAQQLLGQLSDERVKKNIADYTVGLDVLMTLRPRTLTLKLKAIYLKNLQVMKKALQNLTKTLKLNMVL
jgi:hypothetical protein